MSKHFISGIFYINIVTKTIILELYRTLFVVTWLICNFS